MKVMVGYNGGEVGRRALSVARDYAKDNDAFVYVITSMSGGTSEKESDILKAQEDLDFAQKFMKRAGVECECQQSVRGMTPAEDIVSFAEDMDIDHIFLGIKKKSRTQKILLGSTARYVILKANCPVTTVTWYLSKLKDRDILQNRDILIIDKDPVTIEAIKKNLDMCCCDSVSNLEGARTNLNQNTYDLIIFDLMMDQKNEVLEIARNKEIPIIILASQEFTDKEINENFSLVLKNDLSKIAGSAAETLKTCLQGKQGYNTWFVVFKPVLDGLLQ